jgi:hypothetical protein
VSIRNRAEVCNFRARDGSPEEERVVKIEWRFRAPVIEWRGPAPFFYARIPEAVGTEIAAVKRVASYGWGVIPVRGRISGVTFETSLFPRDGTYLLPLKAAVRTRLGVTVGDEVEVEMGIGGEIREPGL